MTARITAWRGVSGFNPECVRNLAPVQMGKDLGVRHRIRGVKIGISLGYSASVVSHK